MRRSSPNSSSASFNRLRDAVAEQHEMVVRPEGLGTLHEGNVTEHSQHHPSDIVREINSTMGARTRDPPEVLLRLHMTVCSPPSRRVAALRPRCAGLTALTPAARTVDRPLLPDRAGTGVRYRLLLTPNTPSWSPADCTRNGRSSFEDAGTHRTTGRISASPDRRCRQWFLTEGLVCRTSLACAAILAFRICRAT